MKNKGLWLFAGIVFLFVTYVIYDYKNKEKSEKRKDLESVLIAASMGQVTGVTMTKGTSILSLKKDKDSWMLTQPIQERAEQGNVQEFVSGIINSKYIEIVQDSGTVDWKIFGLENPAAVFEVTLATPQTVTLKVSSISNFQGELYLRKNEENKVYLVSSEWTARQNKKSLDFRDKRWMRFDLTDLSQFQITNAQGSFSLVKRDGNWVMENPTLTNFDPAHVQELSQLLNYSEVEDYISSSTGEKIDLKKYGFQKPTAQISVGFSDKTKWSAILGVDPKKEPYLKTSKPEFILKVRSSDAEKFSNLRKEDFLSKTQPFTFDATKIKRYVLAVVGQAEYSWSKEKDAWTEERPDPKKEVPTSEESKLKTGKIDQVFARVSAQKVGEYLETLSLKEQQKIKNHLRLMDDQKKLIFELSWSPMLTKTINGAASEGFLVKTSQSKVSFFVPKVEFEKIYFHDLEPEVKIAPLVDEKKSP